MHGFGAFFNHDVARKSSILVSLLLNLIEFGMKVPDLDGGGGAFVSGGPAEGLTLISGRGLQFHAKLLGVRDAIEVT